MRRIQGFDLILNLLTLQKRLASCPAAIILCLIVILVGLHGCTLQPINLVLLVCWYNNRTKYIFIRFPGGKMIQFNLSFSRDRLKSPPLNSMFLIWCGHYPRQYVLNTEKLSWNKDVSIDIKGHAPSNNLTHLTIQFSDSKPKQSFNRLIEQERITTSLEGNPPVTDLNFSMRVINHTFVLAPLPILN